jgi:hypothetical protein
LHREQVRILSSRQKKESHCDSLSLCPVAHPASGGRIAGSNPFSDEKRFFMTLFFMPILVSYESTEYSNILQELMQALSASAAMYRERIRKVLLTPLEGSDGIQLL